MKRRMVSSRVAIIYVMLLFVMSCKDKKSNYAEKLDDIKFLNFKFQHNTLDLKFLRATESTYKIDTNGLLVEKSNTNFFGEVEISVFDENNSIYRMKKYLEKGEKDYYLQDVIFYKNGVVDKSTSRFVDSYIEDEKGDSILMYFNSIGEDFFIEADIFYGDKVVNSDEAKKLKKINLKNNDTSIWVLKSDFVYQDYYIEYSTLITAKFNKNKKHFTSIKAPINDTTKIFYIVRRLL